MLLVAASPTAFAQQVVLDNYFCAEDISNVGNCTANEVSLSGVTNISITDVMGTPLTECVEGSQIKIATLTADLDANTGTRYDVTFWVGKAGNDPRLSSGDPATPGLCVALSLPDTTGSPFIADFEAPNTDNCLDLAQPPAPIEINFGGGGAILTCSDTPTDAFPDGDGIADIQVLTTWQQNTGFACGTGNVTPPYTTTNPGLSPGAPSKCDYTIIDLVPIVAADMEFTKEVTDVNGMGPGASITAAGQVIEYELTVTNNGTATLTGVDAGDPLFDGPGVCIPVSPASLTAGQSMVCTGTYTVTQDVIDDNGGGDGDIDNQAFGVSDQIGILNDIAAVPIIQAPNYTIVKSVTDVGGDGASGTVDADGDVISYSVVVTNTGNVTLTGVDVSDPIFEGFNSATDCSPAAPASLAPGAAMTCTGQYTATQADIDNNGGGDGDIDNTATASSNELSDITDSADVPISQVPNFTIVKSVTDVDGAGPGGTVDAAGDVISYSVVVTNTGNVTLTGVSVADPLFDAPPVCNPVAPATLAPAAVMTCTGQYTAQQSDIDNDGGGDGDIDNTATASTNEVADKNDSAAVPIAGSPAYTILKTVVDVDGAGPGGVVNEAGDVISYSVVVTNTGAVTLNNVAVADPLFDAPPMCNPAAPATLAPAAVMTCTGSYTAQQSDLDDDGNPVPGSMEIANTATVSSDELPDDSDNATVPVVANPGYSIVKTVTDVDGAGPGGAVDAAGDLVTYSIVVTNTGNVTLTNVGVGDSLIAGLNCMPAVPATLDPGDVMNCNGTYAATQADLDTDGGGNGLIENTATVSSDELPDESDNATVPVVSSPAMTLVKSTTTTLVTNIGQVVPYTFVITNTGNTTLTNVVLTDNKSDATPVCVPAQPATLAPGAVMNCTAQHTVTAQELTTLTNLVNIAIATSGQTSPVQDSATVPVQPPPPPPPAPTPPMVPVPVDNGLALALLVLLMLGTAWHLQARQRRH